MIESFTGFWFLISLSFFQKSLNCKKRLYTITLCLDHHYCLCIIHLYPSSGTGNLLIHPLILRDDQLLLFANSHTVILIKTIVSFSLHHQKLFRRNILRIGIFWHQPFPPNTFHNPGIFHLHIFDYRFDFYIFYRQIITLGYGLSYSPPYINR